MSSSGQVIITGIVMLGNARAVEPQKGNRNIAFDVTIPVKDGAKDTLALFRYFTPENKVDNLQKIWSVQFTQAYIVAKIAAMPETGIPSELTGEEVNEYACIGDISEIILIEGAKIYRNPFILASGITETFDSTNLTFTLTPSQYINLSHTIHNCPISCFFDSESKKWKNKKPIPITGTAISVAGMLTRVKRGFNRTITFEIEVDNIAYLNRQTGTSPGSSNYASSSTTPSRRRFNYESSNIPSSSPISTTSPSTSSLGKRKETDHDTYEQDEKRAHTADDKNE